MKRVDYTSRDEWLYAREPWATGTKIKDLAVKPRTRGIELNDGLVANIAQVKLAAEFMTTFDIRQGIEWRNDAERGLFLEEEALAAVEAVSGIRFERLENVLCFADDSILAVSPDGLTKDAKIGLETKCLGSDKHLLAVMASKGNEPAKAILLDEFKSQLAQYFCVIDTLEKIVLGFYDPRFINEKYRTVVFSFTRDDFADEIAKNIEIVENSKIVIKKILGELV